MNTQESAESTAPLCGWGWAFITMLPAGRWLIQRRQGQHWAHFSAWPALPVKCLHYLLLTGTSWNQPCMHPEMSEAKLQLSSRCLGLVQGSQLLLCSTKPSAQKTCVMSLAEDEKEEYGELHNCTTAPVTRASDQGLTNYCKWQCYQFIFFTLGTFCV